MNGTQGKIWNEAVVEYLYIPGCPVCSTTRKTYNQLSARNSNLASPEDQMRQAMSVLNVVRVPNTGGKVV
jgi:hydrogenase maturation factor